MTQYEAAKLAFAKVIYDIKKEHEDLANWELQDWVINYYVNKGLILYIQSIYFNEPGQIDNLINAFLWHGTPTSLIYLGHAIFGKDAEVLITEGDKTVNMVVNNANSLFIYKEATAENDFIVTAENDYIRIDDMSLATGSNVYNLVNNFIAPGVTLTFSINQN